ncbi:hypothetical protein SCHPADRAFT_905063, partial [Schizopora paradoxa]
MFNKSLSFAAAVVIVLASVAIASPLPANGMLFVDLQKQELLIIVIPTGHVELEARG